MNSQDPKIRQIDLEIANLQSKTRFVYTGQGLPNFTPEGRAIYIRQDGGAETTLYVYEGAGWVAKSDAIASDVSQLQTDVGTLQSDVGTLQSDVGTLQSDLSTLDSLAAKKPNNELITGAWKFDDILTLSKTSGKGIKVDTTTPTYPWADLLGAISIRGTGASDPSYNVYRGGIRGYQFDPGEEVFVEFHVPHDYVPGSDIYIHFHHSLTGTTTATTAAGTVTGGTVTWGAEVSYAKGHNQAAFSAPVTTTVVSETMASTLYQHYITEVQLSAASPSASQIDSDLIEVDGLILVRAYLSANNITVSSGLIPDPFLHFVDIHYQSTGIGTKQKSPPFWT